MIAVNVFMRVEDVLFPAADRAEGGAARQRRADAGTNDQFSVRRQAARKAFSTRMTLKHVPDEDVTGAKDCVVVVALKVGRAKLTDVLGHVFMAMRVDIVTEFRLASDAVILQRRYRLPVRPG